MPSKVIITIIQLMFLGINMFWALHRARFNPRLAARAKMSLSGAQDILMPANIISIGLLNVEINEYEIICFFNLPHLKLGNLSAPLWLTILRQMGPVYQINTWLC